MAKQLKNEKYNYRINDEITSSEVRLVLEGQEPIVVSIEEAIKLSEDAGLDLIEISPSAVPPVCKLGEFNKFVYEKKKKIRELKATSTKTILKEIILGPHTGEHDFNFKVVHATNFLKDGAKVKVMVKFQGRQIVFKEHGFDILRRFAEATEDIAKVETAPMMEGRRVTMMLAPKKTK